MCITASCSHVGGYKGTLWQGICPAVAASYITSALPISCGTYVSSRSLQWQKQGLIQGLTITAFFVGFSTSAVWILLGDIGIEESRNCSVASVAIDSSLPECESNCRQFMDKYIFLWRQQYSRIC